MFSKLGIAMKLRLAVVALLLTVALGSGLAFKSHLQADVPPRTGNVDDGGIALAGYDVVAYATTGQAMPGTPRYSSRHDNAVYHFTSAENRTAFEADPGRYRPEYGGYCAYGVRMGRKLPIDPTAFERVDGKLYVFLDRATKLTWKEDKGSNIQIANRIWPDLSSVH